MRRLITTAPFPRCSAPPSMRCHGRASRAALVWVACGQIGAGAMGQSTRPRHDAAAADSQSYLDAETRALLGAGHSFRDDRSRSRFSARSVRGSGAGVVHD